MSSEQKHYPDVSEQLGGLYERLRDYALNASDNPRKVYGLGVILLRGMPTWIKVASEYADLEHISENIGRESIQMQASEKTQLQEILADVLIQHCKMEVS